MNDTDNQTTPELDPIIDDEGEDITFEQDQDTRENTAVDQEAKFQKLKKQIESLSKEKQQYLDSWQRDKAEFLNARKRDEEAKNEFLKFAIAQIVEDLLPLVDSFEAAMKHETSKQGVLLIYNQLLSILKKHGVEEFGSIGEHFDPAKHQAIANVTITDGSEDHTLAEILQKGYSLHGKILRPAFVKVFQA